jgi:hypothetical protein
LRILLEKEDVRVYFFETSDHFVTFPLLIKEAEFVEGI